MPKGTFGQTAIEFKVIKENPFTKVKSVAHYAYDNYSSSPHLSDSRYHPSSLKLFHDLKMKQDEHPYL
jgi:hypothetical protein